MVTLGTKKKILIVTLAKSGRRPSGEAKPRKNSGEDLNINHIIQLVHRNGSRVIPDKNNSKAGISNIIHVIHFKIEVDVMMLRLRLNYHHNNWSFLIMRVDFKTSQDNRMINTLKQISNNIKTIKSLLDNNCLINQRFQDHPTISPGFPTQPNSGAQQKALQWAKSKLKMEKLQQNKIQLYSPVREALQEVLNLVGIQTDKNNFIKSKRREAKEMYSKYLIKFKIV